MKQAREKDSASDNLSQDFDYDSEKLNASIRSDELDEIINKVETDAKNVDLVFNDTLYSPERHEEDKFSHSSPDRSLKSDEKAKDFNLASPDVLKIIKSIPDDLDCLPNEYSEFIQDEDIKIKDLLEDNKITVKEYNKIMKYKYKSQLNLTGLTNVSEINASMANILGEGAVEQSVLFGKNFVNQHEPTQSEVSLFKIQPNEEEGDNEEAKNNKQGDVMNNFSMSKQIEEFKKMLESNKTNEEETEQKASKKYEEKKNNEDFIKDLNSFSSSKQKQEHKTQNENLTQSSTKLGEDHIKLTSSVDANPNEDNIRDTEINLQWDDMIRQATDAPIRK